jgi:signal transduction histidine kinase
MERRLTRPRGADNRDSQLIGVTTHEGLGYDRCGVASADRERLIETALAEATRLNRVARNLLDLFRLQAGAARSEPKLRTVAGPLDHTLARVPSERRLDISLPPDLPLVSVDPVSPGERLTSFVSIADGSAALVEQSRWKFHQQNGRSAAHDIS